MQTGIGIDVVDLSGFERQLRDPASFFVTRTFSEAEIRYANAAHDALRTARLGVRYAAREAFLKAWSSLRNERPPALRTFPYHQDRKSTRLNSSHVAISYAVFCLKT